MRSWIALSTVLAIFLAPGVQAGVFSGECSPTNEPRLTEISDLLDNALPESEPGECGDGEADFLGQAPDAPQVETTVITTAVPDDGTGEFGPDVTEQKAVTRLLPIALTDPDVKTRPLFILHDFKPYHELRGLHDVYAYGANEYVSKPVGKFYGQLAFWAPDEYQKWRAKSMSGLVDMAAEGILETAIIGATGGVGVVYVGATWVEAFWNAPLDVGEGASELVDGVRTGDFDRALDGYTQACSGVMTALVVVPAARGAKAVAAKAAARKSGTPPPASTSRTPATSEPIPVPLATPSPKYNAKNFAPGKLDSHYVKHAREFGSPTRDAYLDGARKLLNSDIGGDIQGTTRPNGDVLRYNTQTNEFAVGQSDGTIRTYFRPTDGIAYWLRQVGTSP